MSKKELMVKSAHEVFNARNTTGVDVAGEVLDLFEKIDYFEFTFQAWELGGEG